MYHSTKSQILTVAVNKDETRTHVIRSQSWKQNCMVMPTTDIPTHDDVRTDDLEDLDRLNKCVIIVGVSWHTWRERDG